MLSVKQTKNLSNSVQLMDAMERVFPDRWPDFDPNAASLETLKGGCATVILTIRANGRPGKLSLRWKGYANKNTINWPAPQIFTLKSVQVMRNTIQPCTQVKSLPKTTANVIRRAPFKVHEAMWPGNTLQTNKLQT